MTISRRVRIGFGVVVLACVVITLTIVGFFHFDPICGEEMGIEKTSPDGLYVAQVMVRNCGATTQYVGHINLRPATSKFHSDFWSGAIHQGEVFTSAEYSGRGDRFCWSKPHKLSIGYPEHPLQNWRDVTIDDDFRNPECQ